MHEQVVASDDAYVTVEKAAEELENLPTECNPTECGCSDGEEATLSKESPPEPTQEELMNALSMQVIQALRQIHQSGDTFAAIVCNPSILEGFTAAFRSLPSEILPDHVREQLPIVPDENIDKLKIVTGTDIEMQFLQNKYGPREDGGTGLIPDLKAILERENSPVRVPSDFLRTVYLLELVDRVKPKIAQVGSDVLRQLSQPNLRR